MYEHIRAVYQQGVFRPLTGCSISENAEVDLFIQPAGAASPGETENGRRREIVKRVVEQIKNNPLPADAPKFTREQLHERP